MSSIIRGIARLLAAAGVLILLLAALAAGAIWLTQPAATQDAHIPGLTAPVAITFDADFVPRIQAQSEHDAAAALGFVHARDRMFQMELMRRAASGRLSELVGTATVPTDRMMRTLGLRARAVADLAALPPETRAVLDAYASGVNAWIDLKGRFAAPEFILLGAPEHWAPADSLLWAKTMGLWLSMDYRQELARLSLAGRIPTTLIDQLWPSTAPAPPPDAWLPTASRFAATRLPSILPNFPAPFTLPAQASNEWAVDGTHTASGAPLLAGDPHLGFSFPGIWYLARIDLPDQVLAGATAPGVPFLVIGRNRSIAWTFTTTGADTQDVFIETQAGPAAYQTPDGPQPFTLREERIKIRGQPDEVLIVRETRHGPVISDLDNPSGPILAVAMGNLQPNDTAAAGLFALNHARSVQEAGAAAPLITSPVQNLLVADKQGIGLFVTGRIPLRKAGDGSVPAPGDGSHDWTGWAAGPQLPHSVAPASGRLVNANEPVAPPDFPVFMGRERFGDWRAQRIRALLDRSNRLTPQDFAAMQVDAQDGFARRVLPILLATPGTTGPSAAALALLRDWDGGMTRDRPQPLIFNAWMDELRRAILRKANIPTVTGAPRANFLAFVLSPAGAGWCGGDCFPLLRDSLATTVATLAAQFGDTPSAWRWGDAHQAVFAHPILQHVPILGAFTTISIPADGDSDTVGAGGINAQLQSVHGAAYRGVYDLADLDRSLFMIAPGQSGNPFNAHARDFVTRWRDGATITLGPAAASLSGTVHLTP